MQKQPFDIIHCSWPQPVEQHDGIWTSEPEWDAPLMPVMPQPQFESINGEPCWTIDWCQIFAAGVKRYGYQCPEEMRGFHIVFHLMIKSSSTLVFWDDDGCLIRRNAKIIHADRTSHHLERSEINVLLVTSFPCSFVNIHFDGLIEKPSGIIDLNFAPEIIGRSIQ